MRLITQKLKTKAEAEDRSPLQSKRKAIIALLPYAVLQERDGQSEMFDAIIHATRASGMVWHRIAQSVSTLLSVASPRAIILVSLYFHRDWLQEGDVIQRWAEAASVAPYSEDVAQSVVDILLQSASDPRLSQHITADIWAWLTKRPSLPPICLGRHFGTYTRVVKAVQALEDAEVLKSYFLLVWSEWNGVLSDSPYLLSERPPTHRISSSCPLSSSTPNTHPPNTSDDVSCSFCLMRISIQKDFGGVGMERHRADLVHHLDHVLTQLDRGPGYLWQHGPDTNADDLQRRKDQYRILRETLLDTINRAPHLTIIPLRILTPGRHRIPHNIYVCTPSSMPVVSRLERSILTPYFVCDLRFDVVYLTRAS